MLRGSSLEVHHLQTWAEELRQLQALSETQVWLGRDVEHMSLLVMAAM